MDEQVLYVNGIDASTGEPLVRPISISQASQIVRAQKDSGWIARLRDIWDRISRPGMGLPEGLNPEVIHQAGWGIVFHENVDPAISTALLPLYNHRQEMIGQEKTKKLVYHAGESAMNWLASNQVTAGSVKPDKVPYYLLLVGGPDQIPFEFERQLAVEYAVGRLSFDRSEEYSRYVEAIISYETSPTLEQGKWSVFFASRHDRATARSADLLVKPLTGASSSGDYQATSGIPAKHGFGVRRILADDATKQNLASMFHLQQSLKPPAFLFSASHGLAWRSGHPEQWAKQGALLCQGWEGHGPVDVQYYLSAEDISTDARLHGLIAFLFACYAAGTPQVDHFYVHPGHQPPQIAQRSFISALPKRLLAHPNGGALAVIGHIDRAWSYSIETETAGQQIQPFENTISRILKGLPVGYAIRDFYERYASLSVSLSEILERVRDGEHIPDHRLVELWVERNDARNYALLGDPACRLRVDLL